jgi:hypothetical protein
MGSAQSGAGEAQAKLSFWSIHTNRILGASALGILALEQWPIGFSKTGVGSTRSTSAPLPSPPSASVISLR